MIYDEEKTKRKEWREDKGRRKDGDKEEQEQKEEGGEANGKP